MDIRTLGRSETYTITEATDTEPSTFPDGSLVVTCTSWAAQARRVLGDRVRIVGFYCDDNPAAEGMARLADGHDFAVIDGRYILDGWLAEVEGEIDDPLIDMEDQANADLIRRYYGDRENWGPLLGVERGVDNETAEQRRRWMPELRQEEALEP